jgi:hypothetical protein
MPVTIKKWCTDMDNETDSLAPAQAARIVLEYQLVLQGITALLTMGAPETMLPAPKVRIQQAIRLAVRTSFNGGNDNTATLDTLRTAYLSLANFLTYEEANAAARLQAAFDRGDRAYIASPAAARTMARTQGIEQEASALAREFDDFLKQFDSDGLLSDIDNFLVDFSHRNELAESR